jgi:hypothetical protein
MNWNERGNARLEPLSGAIAELAADGALIAVRKITLGKDKIAAARRFAGSGPICKAPPTLLQQVDGVARMKLPAVFDRVAPTIEKRLTSKIRPTFALSEIAVFCRAASRCV